jgi:hypothetical protein
MAFRPISRRCAAMFLYIFAGIFVRPSIILSPLLVSRTILDCLSAYCIGLDC